MADRPFLLLLFEPGNKAVVYYSVTVGCRSLGWRPIVIPISVGVYLHADCMTKI